MCFVGAELLSNGIQGLMNGMAARTNARWEAQVARRDGKQARLAADLKASQLDRQGTQELAATRRGFLDSGNLSSLDFVADRATGLANDIALTKYQGAVANAEANTRAAAALHRGRQQLASASLGAATDLLRGGYAFYVDQSEKNFPLI